MSLTMHGKILDMKTIGIIAEFNPFHKGHEYILKASREQFGADNIVVVMSGDYVQRGEPAVVDKYARTRMALSAGADLVLELPLCFATGSAQYFARGAVAALIHCGAIDSILFGSECGDIDKLREPAAGCTPATASNAGKDTVIPAVPSDDDHNGRITPMEMRLSPNDLLAVEYLKALEYFGSDITPLTITRTGTSHNAAEPEGGYASASALRQMLADDRIRIEDLQEYMPGYAYDILSEYMSDKTPVTADRYSDLLIYKLLQKRTEGYAKYFDVYDDLSDKIISMLEEYSSFTAFINSLKSKDISYSHISRALLHILLDVKKDTVEILTKGYGYCPWLRIPGLRKDSPVLNAIKKAADRPLLSKLADADKQLDPALLPILDNDISASELYSYHSGGETGILSEYRRKIVIV